MMAIVMQRVKLKLMAESITLKLVIGKAIFILTKADLKRQSQDKLDLPGLSPEVVGEWIKR